MDLHWFCQYSESCASRIKRKGPSTHPWRTPVPSLIGYDVFFTDVICVVFLTGSPKRRKTVMLSGFVMYWEMLVFADLRAISPSDSKAAFINLSFWSGAIVAAGFFFFPSSYSINFKQTISESLLFKLCAFVCCIGISDELAYGFEWNSLKVTTGCKVEILFHNGGTINREMH